MRKFLDNKIIKVSFIVISWLENFKKKYIFEKKKYCVIKVLIYIICFWVGWGLLFGWRCDLIIKIRLFVCL